MQRDVKHTIQIMMPKWCVLAVGKSTTTVSSLAAESVCAAGSKEVDNLETPEDRQSLQF